MKTLKYISSLCIALLLFINCAEDDNDLGFVNKVTAPTDVSALFQVTQDNTGLVTITPNGDGAVSYNITFGDDTPEPENAAQGESIDHIYDEGTYTVTIEAIGLTGLTSEITLDLVVSFNAPENLDIVIENDLALTKQVNVTANADFAITYDVYFGEDGNDTPVSANIGDTVNYTYQEAGTYAIRVVVMGAAIETTEYIVDFEVTAILQPLASAQTPPGRASQDVISIFSSVYSDVPDTDHFPDWDQGSQGSSWALFNLDGDEILQYINLSYQGIQIGSPVDVSAMEFIHMDVWTADEGLRMETSLISVSNGEKPVWSDLTTNEWTSIEIPISEFTDQGLTVADIHQLKFVGDPWAAGTVFIDNIYFYRAPTTTGPSATPIDFEMPFALDAFDGGATSIIANPDTNGNSSSSVLELVKGAGATWAGSKITVPEPFSFEGVSSITMNVWSPRVGLNLLAKFEDNSNPVVATAEITATSTVAGQWEELTWDFSGIDTAVDWSNLVLIMDNGTEGDGSANYTIYVDDISTNPALDFEPKFVLDAFDGGATSVITNPDTNGNASSMVGELIKGAGATWAGSKITVPVPFSFEGATSLTMKVWSPRVGLNLLAKFEDNSNPVVATAEITATSALAGQWEELTWDFSGIDTAIDWSNLVLIMDNGTEGDGSANYTIYIDDIDIN